jgi:hypothetical protein
MLTDIPSHVIEAMLKGMSAAFHANRNIHQMLHAALAAAEALGWELRPVNHHTETGPTAVAT